MRERIWYELIDSKFRLEFLCLYVDKSTKKNKLIENFLTLSSFGGIGGWFRFAEYSFIWTMLLLLLTGFRIMKSKILITEQEISALNSAYEFYVDHVRKIETLWFKCNSNEINKSEVDIQFEKLRDEERTMTKTTKFSRVPEKKHLIRSAREATKAYIKKIIETKFESDSRVINILNDNL